jgi:ribosomal protein S18 acetylase RimI-like enzyme
MIVYKKLIIDKERILNLYQDNDWNAYTNDFEGLIKGILNSTDAIGAYDSDNLVGLIRTVSDQATICYIQDILVLNSHKNQGIGTKLLTMMLEKYHYVRQVVLMTDINDKRSNQFYKKLGMVEYKEKDCIGYIMKQ